MDRATTDRLLCILKIPPSIGVVRTDPEAYDTMRTRRDQESLVDVHWG